ncbi:hypothetical protein RchiOBHm_Chr1g0376661 [Rosa chinensis]|uniref:Uncharacterized protein n=1 Tax=Rosa chinensis TaxID=74649 RepID=A0A2P6SMW1_ROSCH|nr:hypothetical protein RchiOBHm_Chr1g0376661 [Rosa chinensis]
MKLEMKLIMILEMSMVNRYQDQLNPMRYQQICTLNFQGLQAYDKREE